MTKSTAGTFLFVLLVPLGAALSIDSAASGGTSAIPQFTDAKKQSAEYIGYNRSIKLTEAQLATQNEILSKIDEPCCKKYTAAKCCCDCNLTRTIHGLSAYMIAKKQASPAEVRTAVLSWLHFINPNGFSRDICSEPGACERPFAADGCGGMAEGKMTMKP